MKAVDVVSLTFFTLPVTLNRASPRLVSCSTFQPGSVLCLPTIKALPGVTSRGAFLSSLACWDFDVSVDALVMPSLMALSAVPVRVTQLTMPIRMKAKMITRTTSQVRRFCSDGGKGFLRAGSGANGPDMAGGVVTMTPLLVEGTSLGLGCYPRTWTANPRGDLSMRTRPMRELPGTR